MSNQYLVNHVQNENAKLNLFCFTYAGGGASAYSTWPSELTKDINMYTFQLPGRENRIMDTPLVCIDEVITNLIPCIENFQDKPYAFFGHSLGSIIAYELTKAIQRKGLRLPQRLFVSGRNAPQIKTKSKPLHNLPKEEFVEELRLLDGTPDSILENEELMELVLPMLRADFRMVESYQYSDSVALDCPITVLFGQDDQYTNEKGLGAWQVQSNKKIDIRMFPGGHFYLQHFKEEFLQYFRFELVNVLDEAKISMT